jgi:hypothetical protein
MGNATYANQTAANTAIANNTVSSASAELSALEIAQLAQVTVFDSGGGYLSNVTVQKQQFGTAFVGTAAASTASLITTTTTNFNKVLSAADTTVQAALETLDECIGNGVDNRLARYDTTNKIQTAGAILVDDSDNVSGMGTLSCGAITAPSVTGSTTLTLASTTTTTTVNAGTTFTVNTNVASSSVQGLSIATTGAVTFPLIHFTSTSAGNLCSGTYTPSLTNTTNIAASAVSGKWKYIRVGNIVHVFGSVTIDPTAAGEIVLGISLPITTNLAASTDLNGVGLCYVSSSAIGVPGFLDGDTTNERANYSFYAASDANKQHQITFSYEVL